MASVIASFLLLLFTAGSHHSRGCAHSERLYQRAGDPKDIWRIEGGRHLDAMNSAENRTKFVEYLRRACTSE